MAIEDPTTLGIPRQALGDRNQAGVVIGELPDTSYRQCLTVSDAVKAGYIRAIE